MIGKFDFAEVAALALSCALLCACARTKQPDIGVLLSVTKELDLEFSLQNNSGTRTNFDSAFLPSTAATVKILRGNKLEKLDERLPDPPEISSRLPYHRPQRALEWPRYGVIQDRISLGYRFPTLRNDLLTGDLIVICSYPLYDGTANSISNVVRVLLVKSDPDIGIRWHALEPGPWRTGVLP
jgi:hypothetical protein